MAQKDTDELGTVAGRLKMAESARLKFEQSIATPTSEKIAQIDEKERKRELEARKNDLLQVLKVPEGRRLIYHILELCGPYRASFCGSDSALAAFKEGQRDIGLELLSLINLADPAIYLQMQREHLSDQKSKESAREKLMEEINNGI